MAVDKEAKPNLALLHVSVYKGHSREHESEAFVSSCPLYTGGNHALFINWKMKLPFIDSDLLYRGVLYRQ